MTKYYLALAALIILFIISGLFSLNNLFLYTPDSARYAAWARSLAQFSGYTDYTAPESARYVVHSPLYSFLLAPIAFIAPKSVVALKILNVILSAATIVFIYRIVGNKGNRVVALLTSALYAIHPFVFILSTQLLTEVLFGFCFIVLLYLLQKEGDDTGIRTNFVLIVGAVIGCVFSREIGLVTIFIVAGFFAYRKQYTKAIIIFFIPLIVYIGWYIRNEIYFGSREHLGLRNSALFLTNYYTTADANYLSELWARLVNNFMFYLKESSALVFASPYMVFESPFHGPWMLLVNLLSPFMKVITTLTIALKWVIISVGSALVIIGMVVDFRWTKGWYVKFAFVICYMAIILVYPVIDVRFLFPILLLFLLWIGDALQYLFSHSIRMVRFGSVFIIAAVSVPNIIWSSNFVVTQNELSRDPLGTFMDSPDPSVRVNHRLIVEPLAAEWLNAHLDSTDVVASSRKEQALFLNGAKVIILTGLTSLPEFNNTLRDYNVRYIVNKKDFAGWSEYEYQIGANDRFYFEKVFEKGALEIYRIHPHLNRISTTGRHNELFRNLRIGNFSGVNTYFLRNRAMMLTNPHIMYWAMVNKHMIGELDSVRFYANRLHTMPQGLMLFHNVSRHLTVVDRRELLGKTTDNVARSDIMMTLGVNYWELDMDSLSMMYAKACLKTDSSYALAYVYNIMFALQQSDTAYAHHTAKMLAMKFSGTDLAVRTSDLMKGFDRLRTATNPEEKGAAYESLFDRYNYLGFYDAAIETGLLALQSAPKEGRMYYKLGLLYDAMRKHYPSSVTLQRGKEIVKNDTRIDSLWNAEREKLYLSNR